MDPDDDTMPSTIGAVWYLARVKAGTEIIMFSRLVTQCAEPAEAILVGIGHRIGLAGFRMADVREPLIEPLHPLSRRAAGLGPLPGPKPERALLSADDPRRWT